MAIISFQPLATRPLASEINLQELLPQHRVIDWCERERTVFDVTQEARQNSDLVKILTGIGVAPGVIGAALIGVNDLALHAHSVAQAGEGLTLTTGFFAAFLLCCLGGVFTDRKAKKIRRDTDAPRALREQAQEYDPSSQHVQWAPRMVVKADKVVVQQCRWTMANSAEAERRPSSCDKQGHFYLVEPLWKKEFDSEETAQITALMSELSSDAIELERASWMAYTERRAQLLMEREQEQLVKEQATQVVRTLSSALALN